MSIRIMEGDCREVLPTLPADSVHCVVTSPPYWQKRDYGIAGQLGQEKTPEEYAAALVGVFREVRRVLRPDGSLWLNLGDTYREGLCVPVSMIVTLALRADGWLLRQPCVWYKPNAKPESVKNRPNVAHETVVMLTKAKGNFFDWLAVREGGHNMRSVWSMNTASYRGPHTAVFPVSLPERCIRAGTSEGGVCGRCGAPRSRIIELGAPLVEQQKRCGGNAAGEYRGQGTKEYRKQGAENASDIKRRILDGMREKITKGFAVTCDCYGTCAGCQTCEFTGGHTMAPPSIVPAVVLDPFGGDGTTGVAAANLGRDAILVELNPLSVTAARKRNS